jgi:hypothetical protein
MKDNRIKKTVSKTLTGAIVVIMDMWAEANMPELSLTSMIIICVLATYAACLTALYNFVGAGVSLYFLNFELALEKIVATAVAIVCVRMLTSIVGLLAEIEVGD